MTQRKHWEANTPKSWSAAQKSHLTRLSPEGFHFQLFTFSFFEFTKNDTITGQEKIASDLNNNVIVSVRLSYSGAAECGGAGSDLTKAAQQDRDCCQRLQSRSLELITVLFCIFTGATALPVQTKWMLQGAIRFQRSKTSSRGRCWLVFCCWRRPTPLSLPSLAFLCCASAKSKSASWHELTLSLKQEYPARTHTHARTHSKAVLDVSRETIYTLWSIKWYAKAQNQGERAKTHTEAPFNSKVSQDADAKQDTAEADLRCEDAAQGTRIHSIAIWTSK